MSAAARSPITTHILDVSLGKAAANVTVVLEAQDSVGGWRLIRKGATNSDGRIEDLMEQGSRAAAGTYRLTFDLKSYFDARGSRTFYPSATVVFEITEPSEHHHVPLLLSPFGYSTYRGT